MIVLTGAARIAIEGQAQPRELKAGDYLLIAPHTRHRVEWTDPDRPTVWLAVHYPEQFGAVVS